MTESLLYLDPSKVQADDNTRFALKKSRVASMKDAITAAGGVQTPVEVEALAKPLNGYTHRLTYGFYRHAALSELNKEGAGLQLPVIVRSPSDALDRVRRQLSENRDRENMSPMDEATGIKRLLDAGVARAEVMKLFARPTGRKGITIQPASNAYLNMMLSFLDLPKGMQTKIHEGLIGVKAAYELTKVAPEEREDVLAKAETLRQRELDAEEKEEARLLGAEQKSAAQQAKDAEKVAKLTEAEEALAAAEKEANEAKAARIVAAKVVEEAKKLPEGVKTYHDLTPDQKTAQVEGLKAAKTDERGAEKRRDAALKALTKAQERVKALAEPKPKAAKAEAPAPAPTAAKAKKAVTSGDVRKAAKESGAAKGPQALTLPEFKEFVGKLGRSRFPKVKEIGLLLAVVLTGEKSTGAAETDLSVLTGERTKTRA